MPQFTPEELLGPLNEVEARRSPESLYVAGDASLLRKVPRVSVVGSRKASPDGIRRAQELSRLLVGRGAVVVSGLAEGIDTAGHRAAINAGGRTIGVIGTPLEKSYPPSNQDLQRVMREKHAVVSQFPVGHPTLRTNFPMRNATMALIVSAAIIVEAAEGSGTLSHGWAALRLGRPLFIVDSVCSNPLLAWPGKMMEAGAKVLSDDNLEEFWDTLPTHAPVSTSQLPAGIGGEQ